MAHVLAHGKKGPRPASESDSNIDRYENLVLLCPYHHTLVDKAPDDFPTEMLHKWKSDLEKRIDTAAHVPEFTSKDELYNYVSELLSRNEFIHTHFGPASETAQKNPFSNLHALWRARKVEEIIPNNTLITTAMRRFRKLLSSDELRSFSTFEAHALAFADSAQERRDSVPMFPVEFSEMIAARRK